MNTKTRNATLFGIAAGIVLVPIIRAVVKKYRLAHREEPAADTVPPNNLFSSYLGKHKPHHRKPKSTHNGVH
jgi:hypothetical protein